MAVYSLGSALGLTATEVGATWANIGFCLQNNPNGGLQRLWRGPTKYFVEVQVRGPESAVNGVHEELLSDVVACKPVAHEIMGLCPGTKYEISLNVRPVRGGPRVTDAIVIRTPEPAECSEFTDLRSCDSDASTAAPSIDDIEIIIDVPEASSSPSGLPSFPQVAVLPPLARARPDIIESDSIANAINYDVAFHVQPNATQCDLCPTCPSTHPARHVMEESIPRVMVEQSPGQPPCRSGNLAGALNASIPKQFTRRQSNPRSRRRARFPGVAVDPASVGLEDFARHAELMAQQLDQRRAELLRSGR